MCGEEETQCSHMVLNRSRIELARSQKVSLIGAKMLQAKLVGGLRKKRANPSTQRM